jgi:hypothetical protein
VTAIKDRMRLRLKTPEFDRIARAVLGVKTDGEIAERLRTHPTTLSQYRTGRRPLPADFVAACKNAMPDIPLETFIESVPESAFEQAPERAG